MIIGSTFYNAAGELMAPRSVDITIKTVTPGGFPTTEAGFYHRFKFEGATKAERAAKSRRFHDLLAGVDGSMVLSRREYTVAMGAYVRHGLDVVYVVESPAQHEAALAAAQRAGLSHAL